MGPSRSGYVARVTLHEPRRRHFGASTARARGQSAVCGVHHEVGCPAGSETTFRRCASSHSEAGTVSGRLDSNQRLLAPKASALAGLSYAPKDNEFVSATELLSLCNIRIFSASFNMRCARRHIRPDGRAIYYHRIIGPRIHAYAEAHTDSYRESGSNTTMEVCVKHLPAAASLRDLQR